MTGIPDPIAEGLASGWQHHDGSQLERDLVLEADVAIIGTGAGGGVSAEILSAAGLKVVLLEEGPLRSSRDFRMQERIAYPELYQEAAGRRTADKGISILQGRAVGGSTLVNWTTSFRTPEKTLEHWDKTLGLPGYGRAELEPWFARQEKRLNIEPWAVPPNANNEALRRGCEALGVPAKIISRNVKGCWNLGYCGMGCPTNAKQSMLVTTLPEAWKRGAVVVSRCRVERLDIAGEQVRGVLALGMDEYGQVRRERRITVKARHTILAAGAIGSPAVLLRSEAPDPQGVLGRRTFLHPVVVSTAISPTPIKGFEGAPQSVYSDHFLWPEDGRCGFKLEVPPMHPLIGSVLVGGHGRAHRGFMERFDKAQAIIALMRDGFHEEAPGGRVRLDEHGFPLLDYPITDYLWEGMRRAYLAMAEIQFAAGMSEVMPLHEDAGAYTSWAQARKAIAELPMAILHARVVSAHVMGGCALSKDARDGVVDPQGRHHQLENLSVFDGSIFPTSLGANPQLSIYAMVARLAEGLAGELGGRKKA
ncbi:MAG: GMC family oxidoreductase [Gammaproteobacteria bacterium]|nr:GMC family oxidoreductase [Gammaproteobacteria bacterium]